MYNWDIINENVKKNIIECCKYFGNQKIISKKLENNYNFTCSHDTIGRYSNGSTPVKIQFVVALINLINDEKDEYSKITIEDFFTKTISFENQPLVKIDLLKQKNFVENKSHFSCNFNDYIYKKYLGYNNKLKLIDNGIYNIYYFVTEQGKESLIQPGKLCISYKIKNYHYTATLTIETSETPKIYEGSFWLSVDTKTCFFSLTGKDFPEKILIITNDPHSIHSNYKCGIGVIASFTSDTNRDPCIQKILISKKNLNITKDGNYREIKNFLTLTNEYINKVTIDNDRELFEFFRHIENN